VKTYVGAQIEVTFDGDRCLHAAECVRGLPAVFDAHKRPWIQPDGADATAVAEVVRRCPSGALTIGGPVSEAPERPTTVEAPKYGPLFVRGDLRIAVGDEVVETPRAALCRCGSTANRPFCDGSGRCTGWRQ